MGRLFFKPIELAPYFPASVLRHMVGHAHPYEPNKNGADPPNKLEFDGLLEVPAGKLPIVVAARASLGFPFLISALPFWAIDHEPRLQKDRDLKRCWFSDSSLCSNFPIHLFDSFVPKWPTFGISLYQRSPYRKKTEVWLPQRDYQGRGDTWDRFDGNELTPWTDRLSGFAIALWKAAWQWERRDHDANARCA